LISETREGLMLIPVLLVVASAGSACSDSAAWTRRYDLAGCGPGGRGRIVAVSPDTRTAAVVRAQKDGGGEGPTDGEMSRDEIAYVELGTGRDLATHPLQVDFEPHVVISNDASLVVILRQFDSGMQKPFNISVWRPRAKPEELKDYDLVVGSQIMGRDRQSSFASGGDLPPAISPDGTHVAVFGYRNSGRYEPPYDHQDENAIGILDLETGKVAVMILPVQVPREGAKYWHLGWSSDGTGVYAVLHPTYSEERGEVTRGAPIPLARRPDLSLYRFSLATLTAEQVGEVPPTTCGFGPDDDLIIADALRQGWGPHRSFALLPIREVERRGRDHGAFGLEAVATLGLRTVVTEDDPNVESFSQVFVGRNHTFAEVIGKTNRGCKAIIERTADTKQGAR
jgi:hypothetical protein